MDIKDFFLKTKNGDLGGKINLSILPDGIEEEKGEIKVRFSLLIGLNIDQDAIYNDDYKNGFEFIQEIGKILNNTACGLALNISKKTLFEKGEDLFTWRHYRRWNRLLSDNEFLMGHKISNDSASSIKEISTHIKDARNNPLISSISENKSRVEMLLDAENSNINIDLKIQKNESKFDSINYAGQKDAFRVHANQEMFIKSKFVDCKNLINIINGIYQHPTMAEYYGLLYNFPIDKKDLVSDYLSNKETLVCLQMDNNVIKSNALTNYFQVTNKTRFLGKMDLRNFSTSEILDVIQVESKTEAGKYYHGLKNYGIISNNEIGYKFTTVSDSNDLQNQKLVLDERKKIKMQNGSLSDFSSTKRKVTEGIYLHQINLLDPNDSTKYLPLQDLDKLSDNFALNDGTVNLDSELNIGLLGQSINVVVNNSGKKRFFSLCKREAIYDPKGWFNTIRKVEEGWLHTAVAVNSITDPYHPQTIFHWTGDNLCVHKSLTQAHTDQKLTPDEKDQAGAAKGTFNFGTKYDEQNPEDRGYTFDYKPVPGADTQLVDGNEYSFLLKQVLSNGYTFPLTSNNKFELSLLDVLKSNLLPEEFFFNFGRFSLDDDSISPPVLVGNKIFEGKGDKCPESGSHLVLLNLGDSSQRFVFPSIIEAQFGKFLGFLSKERLNVSSKEEYKSIGKRIFERAKEKILPFANSNEVTYLPDIRGQQLVISPADWFTRSVLINAQANLHLAKEDYFIFSEIKSDFKHLQAGNLTIIPAGNFQWTIDKNSIQIKLPAGLQLSFCIQLQENTDLKKNFLEKTDFDRFRSLLQSKGVLLSEHNHPKYAKGQFFTTRAVAKPETPLITNVSEVIRPTKSTDLNKIFYTFRVKNPFPYLKTVKQLQIKSTFSILTDGSKSAPDVDSQNIKEEVSSWQSSNKDFDLLNNEYPSIILNKQICQTETEVYKNNFGFIIKLDQSFLDDLLVNPGDNIVHLNAGNNFDLYLRYDSGAFCSLFCSKDREPDIKNIDITEETKITISFSLYSNPSELGFSIYTASATANQTYGDINGKIPYVDLSEKNLSLLQKIEQKLLLVEDENNQNQLFKFEHEGEFFVYRAEATTCYFKKSVQILAISRFPEYYPSLLPSQLISDLSDKFELLIKNNSKPNLPAFEITPLIFHQTDLINNNRKRSMQIMFEIERPLQNDETFALILSDDGKITPSTCAIGRDLTTFNLIDFADTGTPTGFSIDRFIFYNSEPKYLPKYFSESSLDRSSKALTTTTHKILPLIPYFEKEKNKWIVVLALDQKKLKDNNLNAYNPFIKIVAIIYSANSTTGNYSSEFTKPKYINLISERCVSVNINDGRQCFWNIEVKNKDQIKMDNKGNRRSVFVACLREKSYYGVNGHLVKSLVVSTEKKMEPHYFHVFQDKLFIQFQKNKSLSIYEFETFDNLIESDNPNWLQESKARMIYAEDF